TRGGCAGGGSPYSLWKWLGGSWAAWGSFGSGPNASRREITRWASWRGMDWVAFSWNPCAKPRISSLAACASINASPPHSSWAPAALCWRGHSHRESRLPTAAEDRLSSLSGPTSLPTVGAQDENLARPRLMLRSRAAQIGSSEAPPIGRAARRLEA